MFKLSLFLTFDTTCIFFAKAASHPSHSEWRVRLHGDELGGPGRRERRGVRPGAAHHQQAARRLGRRGGRGGGQAGLRGQVRPRLSE